MAFESHISQADRCFVEEDYVTAISLYTKVGDREAGSLAPLPLRPLYPQALEQERSAAAYDARAHAFLKNEDYLNALDDATKAIELDPSLSKAYLRQG